MRPKPLIPILIFIFNPFTLIKSIYLAPLQKKGVFSKLGGKCSGLSYLCLVQGGKAQFSGLNEHFPTMK
tara:strand:+ start:29740 stop:29946 length:207 start_codon:yes stop_codon:yes gene_type:complete